jgi:hypothetical protein
MERLLFTGEASLGSGGEHFHGAKHRARVR